MCGLVGLITKRQYGFTKDQQNIFSELLFIDYVRGNDSTGVFLVANNGDVSVAKEASDPIDFMATPEYGKIMTTAFRKGGAIIGHNRKATRGDIVDANAHPFIVENNIILAHNGTVYGDHKKMADVEVDSHAIAHSIHEHGEDIEAALKELHAAYALIWYDFDKGQLNLVRNNERPLWFMETHTEWIWASERSMLNFVKDRYNLTTMRDPTPLQAGDHQRFTLTSKGEWTAGYKTLKLETSGVKQYGYWPANIHDGDASDLDFYDYPPHTNIVSVQPQTKVTNFREITPIGNNAETTPAYERQLAKNEVLVVANKRFLDEILNTFPADGDVMGTAIAWCYANQKDGDAGYYLYLLAVDDQDVMIRLTWDGKHMTTKRLDSFVNHHYIFKAKTVKRRWSSFRELPSVQHSGPPPSAEGYVVIEAEDSVIVHGGSIMNEGIAKKAGLVH